jgi:hypothetical protein
MVHDECHPDVPPSDWNTFRNEFLPYLFEEILDRSSIKLPEWFLPSARGAEIASPYLLHRAGYRPGSRRAPSWDKLHCDVLSKDIGSDSLKSGDIAINPCGRSSRVARPVGRAATRT